MARKKALPAVVGHVNHGARGEASDADQRFVERLCRRWGLALEVGRPRAGAAALPPGRKKGAVAPGFEKKAREERYAFLEELRERSGAARILVAHTADDQVETVLMRLLEGAGISGLKGIPRATAKGIERPLLDTWRADILSYLRRHGIPYRTDRTNADTRFERNWIRHVLLPLLEKRYGTAVRRRLFALGERFREIDAFLDATARRWTARNVERVKDAQAALFRLPRARYAKLPPAVRKRIVQCICYDRLAVAPNERLLEALDKVIVSGNPSARVAIGGGAVLSCRYGDARFGARASRNAPAPQAAAAKLSVREVRGRPSPARLKALAAGGRRAAFDAEGVGGPFSVRPLRAGDRVRPLGSPGRRKVKDILIDRKVPREQRWGRPVVCDAKGDIVWIPGVVRSSVAPVTRSTRRTVMLEMV